MVARTQYIVLCNVQLRVASLEPNRSAISFVLDTAVRLFCSLVGAFLDAFLKLQFNTFW